jgi:energy-coupling factor transporter ATP-binding protein EcfA2
LYDSWSILLDTAATKPGLGFDEAAGALSDLALNSPAQFAIGIFGVWGSGKTTLMRTIHAKVKEDSAAVPVWFNAWRYEREEHLIVPMLDTIRDELVVWCAGHPADEAVVEGRVQKAASTFAKAARAILLGVTLKTRLGGVEAAIDANKVVAEWRDSGKDSDEADAVTAQSFYHASFQALEGAVEQFVGDVRRIVVFIDDLDRCLPEHALQVLESMKLFFDLPGFVFVVGLDSGVIERAVASKFGGNLTDTLVNPAPGDAGGSYVKKIFQVQFTVPRVLEAQLVAFIALTVAGLPDLQATDMKTTAHRHLRHLATNGSVNQREVKRFLNDYTVQLKMLERKLGTEPDRNVVLALLTMSFHPEWRSLYEQLVIDPEEFQGACRDVLESSHSPLSLQLGPTATPLPPAFLTYLQGAGKAIVRPGLEAYVSSVEATSATDSTVIEMMRSLRATRRAMANIEDTDVRRELPSAVDRLHDLVKTKRGPGAEAADRAVTRMVAGMPPPSATAIEGWQQWVSSANGALQVVDYYVRELRRRTT